MVFDKYYDRSLLLMLLGDKNNNEMIINFLKFMPEEMHKYIKKSIALNSHNAVKDHFRIVEFDNMNMLSNDGCMYTLKCSLVNGLLVIKLNRFCIGTKISEVIVLTLQPLRRYDLDSDLNIGSFYYELNNNSVFDNVTEKSVYSKKYDIKKIPFDKLIVMSGCKCTSGIISTDSCFEKISLESLFNDERFNKCSKKRILRNDRKGNR